MPATRELIEQLRIYTLRIHDNLRLRWHGRGNSVDVRCLLAHVSQLNVKDGFTVVVVVSAYGCPSWASLQDDA